MNNINQCLKKFDFLHNYFSDDPMVSYKITNRPIKTTAIKRIERADKETCPVHILVDGTRYRIRLRDHFLSVEKPKKGRSNPI